MRMNVVVTVRLQSIDCEIAINCEITRIIQVREIQMSGISDIREEYNNLGSLKSFAVNSVGISKVSKFRNRLLMDCHGCFIVCLF